MVVLVLVVIVYDVYGLILQVYEDTQINVCMSVQRVQLFYKRPVSLPYKDESIRISRNSKSGL